MATKSNRIDKLLRESEAAKKAAAPKLREAAFCREFIRRKRAALDALDAICPPDLAVAVAESMRQPVEEGADWERLPGVWDWVKSLTMTTSTIPDGLGEPAARLTFRRFMHGEFTCGNGLAVCYGCGLATPPLEWFVKGSCWGREMDLMQPKHECLHCGGEDLVPVFRQHDNPAQSRYSQYDRPRPRWYVDWTAPYRESCRD